MKRSLSKFTIYTDSKNMLKRGYEIFKFHMNKFDKYSIGVDFIQKTKEFIAHILLVNNKIEHKVDAEEEFDNCFIVLEILKVNLELTKLKDDRNAHLQNELFVLLLNIEELLNKWFNNYLNHRQSDSDL